LPFVAYSGVYIFIEMKHCTENLLTKIIKMIVSENQAFKGRKTAKNSFLSGNSRKSFSFQLLDSNIITKYKTELKIWWEWQFEKKTLFLLSFSILNPIAKVHNTE